MSPYKITVV